MKFFYLLLFAVFMPAKMLIAQINITLDTDSVHVSAPASQVDIPLPSHVTNSTGGSVVIRWTRVVEQRPFGWDNAFCDKNLCYLAGVGSKTFELAPGEEGLLKPIFYPFGNEGVGIMRLYYISETPGVVWADTAVYVAVATGAVGSVEVEQVHDISIFPNPATDMLYMVSADAALKGYWNVSDIMGKVWMNSDGGSVALPTQISISQLPVGIFSLNIKISDTDQQVTRRFIVKR